MAHGQEPTITPNYKDADLRQIVEAVGEVTGKNFLLDPRVDAKVTMLSSTPMSPDAFYEAFLSILEVHGFVAIPSDDLIKILPNASARQYPAYSSTSGAGGDDLVTQVIQVKNVGAAQLVPILRPLIPQYGHLAAHPGSNMLIISDRAANVMRMLSIIRRIDQSNDEDIEVVPLSHASAAEIVRVLTTLTQTPRTDGMPVTTSLVADPRTNSVLIGGDRSERLRLRALIAHLDTPLEDGGDTQVRYLRYADAEELSTKLQQHFTAQLSAQGQGGQAAAGAQQISVWSDPQTNALIINAPPKMMRSLMQIVDKLDIRRAQVLVEAIIVEVTADKASELGVTWAVDGSGSNSVVGVTRFTGAGTNVVDLAGLVGTGTGADPTGLISDGITTAVGRISERGTSFAAILNALEGDADTNIISTPTLVTTDNEEASIKVGQEVPFVTGSFSSTGSNTGGVNPFQTIQREQVGVKLTITPQINEGDAILLQISQEISSIAESATAGAADLITNERTIDTTVIVEDGGILVLGGLIEDTLRENTQRVPILGRIPIMGALFRNRSVQKVKTNLMVFIRPKILRDASQTAIETGAKYNYIRDMQRSDRVPQLRGVERPVIPPLDAVGGYEDDDGEKNYDGN
ncbi:MAG: type II secretion system secretin GspD [Woeseia sp.]|nr:type II secretion system secretin GspD [Woeseia sp.]MBT8095650.1 type II secretion system secretin GspD [Woeseia sp.]